MKAEDFDIVGSYNNQRVSNIDSERTVNLFEYFDVKAKKVKSLINTSGLNNTNITFPGATGGFRAQFIFKNIEYSVIGSSVYRRTPDSQVSLLGSINTTTGYVGIDANINQVIFVDGVNGWIWETRNSTFTKITDTSFPALPIDVCYLDGFFVVAHGGTNQFQLSQFNNGMIWGPAQDTFTASAATNLITLANTDNYSTGTPVTFSVSGSNTAPFLASTVTNKLTISSGTDNYGPTGNSITVAPGTGGTLPTPLVSSTVYYTIIDSSTELKLATTKANALANVPITLTSNGTPPNNITAQGVLPEPIVAGTTYYVIRLSNTTIRLATTPEDAYDNNPIQLLTDGSGTRNIRSIGQLQQASITSHPGNIVACRTLHRRLFLFSEYFTEVWANAGIGTNLPFRRQDSLLMEYGTPSIGSIAVGFDKMFFLSQDRDGLGSVMEVIGSESIPISNLSLDNQLSEYAEDPAKGVSDCRAFLVKENGLIFYRMNFTKANHTFVYNVSLSNPSSDQSKMWHEEEVLNGNRHPAQTHSYFNGINYVGHYSSPTLYILDDKVYTNDGEAIRRMRITRPVVVPGYQRRRVDRLQIDLQQGQLQSSNPVTTYIPIMTQTSLPILTQNGQQIYTQQSYTVYQPFIPYVFLSLSKDGGQSYGYLVKTPMGKYGQRQYRTLWRKLGVVPRGQAFVAKFEFFDPIPIVILGASWANEILPE